MALFKRKPKDDNTSPDPNERSPQLGVKFKDLAVLGSLIDAGADLSQPRHVVFYLYFPDERSSTQAAEVVRAWDYTANVREPLPDYPGQWSLVCECQTVTSPQFIRDADDLFEELAATHGGDYDGREASV